MKNLLMPGIVLAFAIGATDTFADDRRGGDRGRGPDRSFDRDFDRDYDKSFDRGFNTNRWSSRRDRDRVSVNINFNRGNVNRGNVNRGNFNDRWRPAIRPWGWNNFGYSVGFGTWGSSFGAWSGGYPVYRSQQPVVVYQNTWMDPGPRSTVTTVTGSGTSLLRDINGRCFERSYDRYGNETRVELPAAACNF